MKTIKHHHTNTNDEAEIDMFLQKFGIDKKGNLEEKADAIEQFLLGDNKIIDLFMGNL